MQAVEDSFFDNNKEFLKRSHVAIGKTILAIADPTDDIATYTRDTNLIRANMLAGINQIDSSTGRNKGNNG